VEGDVTVVVLPDPKQNLTLVHGAAGWCFYDPVAPDQLSQQVFVGEMM
jgi:hypothetical protein